MNPDKDLIIVGAGIAGLSAAQYAARANLGVLVLEEMATGGQILVVDRLENYPGFPEPITGVEISQRFEEQARRFGAEIQTAGAHSLTRDGHLFRLDTDNGPLTACAVIVATGAKHKKLEIPGEQELSGRGVSYCATCDGPLFKDRRMLVVGGGDAACDEAKFLSNLTNKLLMVHRRERFRAQKALAERVLKDPHIEVRFNTQLTQIRGDGKVAEAVLLDNSSGRTYAEPVDAVFIFIGSIPQTQIVRELGVEVNEAGYIVTNQRMETNIPGLYAVGDVRATPFRQLVVGAGDGAVAAHLAAQYIDALKGEAYA
jgi:thioredoxin reductase (NADPH)